MAKKTITIIDQEKVYQTKQYLENSKEYYDNAITDLADAMKYLSGYDKQDFYSRAANLKKRTENVLKMVKDYIKELNTAYEDSKKFNEND